MAKKDCQDNL